MLSVFLLTCLALAPLGGWPAPVQAQGSLAVVDMTTGLSAANLVNALLGADSGITVDPGSIVYTGAALAAGTFTGGTAAFGFDAGLILSTGRADGVIGADAGTHADTNNATPGDMDLQTVVGFETYDAAIVEFDFVPSGDHVGFIYVFASEEYNEYVGEFNDGFALFINGVNHAEITRVDGQNVPVTINNINLGSNPQYYRNNVCSDGPCVNAPTSMDGLTVVLALRAPVNRGQVNRAKLAIADAVDSAYDSNVMIKLHSMTTREADLSLEMTSSCYTCALDSEVTFDLALHNAGPDAASGVQVRDLLPPGLTFVSATPSQGTYNQATGIWAVGSLAVDGDAALSLVARVAAPGLLENVAEVVASDQIDPDSTPNNGIPGEDDYARVRINDASNNAPTNITLSNNRVDEESPTGTLVGYLSTTDPDSGDTHVYSLTDSAGGRFAIDGTRLVVDDGTLLDYETDTSHDVTVRSTDAGGLYIERVFTIHLNDVEEPNAAPVLATNTGLTVDEGGSGAITATHLQVTDADNTAGQLTYTVGTAPTRGSLRRDGVALTNGGTYTQADIDAGLLSYAHDGSQTTSDSFTFTVADGAGGSIGLTTFAITVNPVNDPPVITAPVGQTVLEDHILYFLLPPPPSPDNRIVISDPDAGDGPVRVTLAATHGLMTLYGTTGLTFTTGDGTSDATMVFTGTIPAVNMALNGMMFRPTIDYFGAASIEVTVNDQGHTGSGGALEDTATVDITVIPVNDAPTFVPGPHIEVDEDCGPQTVAGWATAMSPGPANESGQALTFYVSPNDSPLFAAQPAISAVTGDLTFTPAADASGMVTLTVTLRDDGGTANGGVDTSAAHHLVITVQPVDDAPEFTSVPVTGATQDVAYLYNITATDADSGDVLTITAPLLPTWLALTDAGDGTATLAGTPGNDDVGAHGVSLLVTDSTALTATQIFTITVANVNDAPVAVDDTAQTLEDTAVDIDVLANDYDIDGDDLSIISVGLPQYGAAAEVAGMVRYTPAADFFGTDVFTYTISDGELTDTATVTVTVIPVNDAPSFTGGGDVTVDEDCGPQNIVAWASDISAGPTNESGQALTFYVSPNDNPLFSVQPTISAITGNLTFTPAADANGVVTLTVTLRDDGGTANGGVDASAPYTFTLTVRPMNDAPVAVDDVAQTLEDTPVVIAVLDNDIDVDDDILTVTAVTTPTHGLATISAGTTIIYTPTANWNGTDVFGYTVSDGELTDTATITVTVIAVNDAPSFTPGPDIEVDEDCGPQTVAAWATDISAGPPDEAGQALSFAVSTNNDALFAALPAISATTGNLTFTPADDAYGIARLTVTLHDDGGTDHGGIDTSPARAVTITVHPVNDAPVAVDDLVETDEDTPVAIFVLDNDYDVDGDLLTIVAVGDPLHGVAVIAGNAIVYTPTLNFFGDDWFDYVVSDGVLTDTATVWVTVHPVNDVPTITPIADQSVWLGTTTVGPLAFTIGDVETLPDDLLLWAESSNHDLVPEAAISLGGSGAQRSITITPTEGITGTAVITLSVDDGEDIAQTSFTLSVSVRPIWRIYSPVIMFRHTTAPDLVVDEIRVVGNNVQVTIRNAGNRAVLSSQAFYVDLYINPSTAPTRVGQIWPDLAPHGAVWGVSGAALPLAPGATLQLVTRGAYYLADESNLPTTIPESARLYAHVDSVDIRTTYGAVLESHEIINGPYNNIAGPGSVVRIGGSAQPDEDALSPPAVDRSEPFDNGPVRYRDTTGIR
jgi:uncharacterized repeat protein (TIGR01451 family)